MKRLLALLLLSAAPVFSAVRLPAILSDHMVVQAEIPVPIWGWADAGEEVTVTLAGKVAKTKANDDGKWQVRLAPIAKTSESQTLAVQGANKIIINDVLVGEVWLGSGQSNMAMLVQSSLNADEEVKQSNFPQIRMFTVERHAVATPQEDCKGRWEVAGPKTTGRFSAALYFMGRELHQELKQPVGLINSSWGGTAIEAWTSMEAQAKLPEYKRISQSWTEATSVPWDEKKALAEYDVAVAEWKKTAEQAKEKGQESPRPPVRPVDPRLHQNHPANLYNGMIAPLIPYAIRGAVWYQGEHNTNKPYADLYSLQLGVLIKDWRARWGTAFPFAWVQLPDFNTPQKSPVEIQRWTVIREQMLHALSVPKTGMAITLGLGEAKEIHPKNKQGVGHRLALWALGKVYGQKAAETSGPLFSKHEIKERNVIISFTHTNGGLKIREGQDKLTGFAIAGKNRRFVWAQARIAGNRVIVSSPDVPEPVAVRYAWADNPLWSLENGAGLPASPFRTDDWQVDLRLAALFSDHMVVQAGVPVPVWGWADPGQEITVMLAGKTAVTQTPSSGMWQTKLEPLKMTREPQELVVKGKSTLIVKDVLIGEVWLASGQSNMAYPFSRGQYIAEETAAADLPQIRMFTVGKNSARRPQRDCEGEWVVATPESVQAFSAVAWFFGKDLHEVLNRPVGLINSSWGGTDIAAWTSEPRQASVPELKAGLDKWERAAASYDGIKEREAYNKRLAAWEKRGGKGSNDVATKRPRWNVPPQENQNHPANLFNGMIFPVIPYAIQGVIWYQGEHNCSTPEKAELYAKQLPILVQDWRHLWRVNFPFAWVQLPNFEQTAYRPLVREAMLKSLSVPNTGMVVTLDVGEANDNHPRDKKTVGQRLSLWAQSRVYKRDVPAYSGPIPLSHEVKEGTVVVKFNHTQGGLKAKEGALKGFEIAGVDQQWKPAQGKIQGGSVVVSNAEIIQPVAVRYAWAANPEANLFNGAGLPASPFRTDDWDPAETGLKKSEEANE